MLHKTGKTVLECPVIQQWGEWQKAKIIREIDALGGMSGIITDASSIQFRMLNKSKGPAIWSPRAQCDRKLFEKEWRLSLESNKNIDFDEDTVENITIENSTVTGLITKMGISIKGKECCAL